MTSSSRNLNIKGTHGGFDVRAGGDEKQKIKFAWPNSSDRSISSSRDCIPVIIFYYLFVDIHRYTVSAADPGEEVPAIIYYSETVKDDDENKE